MSGERPPDSRRRDSAHGSIPHHEREETLAATRSDLPAEVRQVADALIASLGDNLRALLWHGSWARGEAKPDSDHDLIIILKRIDDDALLRMQKVFRGRAEWSTFVQTEEELRQYPPDGRPQFHFGLVPLYGDFQPPPFTRDNLLADLRVLARDIRFECRYRLLHREPDYDEMEQHYRNFLRARNARMLRYAAKLAVLALKARELLLGRPYSLTREELRSRLADPDELAIVDIIDRWAELKPQYEQDTTPLALTLDAFARKLGPGWKMGNEQ
ncbi:MAG: nucleotidyltransferase domain-containing protein [Chloroflexi bacterium]|nr:nucleotidyltransferase domain-containing protein [Chloroflexota bacterium]